jgi:hypothetical protein
MQVWEPIILLCNRRHYHQNYEANNNLPVGTRIVRHSEAFLYFKRAIASDHPFGEDFSRLDPVSKRLGKTMILLPRSSRSRTNMEWVPSVSSCGNCPERFFPGVLVFFCSLRAFCH